MPTKDPACIVRQFSYLFKVSIKEYNFDYQLDYFSLPKVPEFHVTFEVCSYFQLCKSGTMQLPIQMLSFNYYR